jgi:hypothetical protein
MPSASTLTRRPASGVFRLGFRAWRIAFDKNKPAAPDVLKVMCVKKFQRRQNSASCPVFPKTIEDRCGQNGGQTFCMTKQKTTSVELAKSQRTG